MSKVYYADGSSNLSFSARFLNFFRGIPFVLLAAISLIIVLSPNLYELSQFMDKAEDNEWNSLYIICGPLALIALIATILRWKKLEALWVGHIGFCLLYPLVVGFSIWLWELLGIVLMFFFFGIFLQCIEKDEDDKSKKPLGICYIVVGGLYLIARLATGHAGWTDVALLSLYGVFLLYNVIVAIMTNIGAKENYFKVIKPVFYLSIPLIISVFLMVLLFIAPNISYPYSNTSATPSGNVISPSFNYFYCTSNNINVRELPNKTSKRLGTLNLNYKVNVLSYENDFAKIDFNGKIGYVYGIYLQNQPVHAIEPDRK